MAELIPKGHLRNLYCPKLELKVQRNELSSSRGICQNPSFSSNIENILLPANFTGLFAQSVCLSTWAMTPFVSIRLRVSISLPWRLDGILRGGCTNGTASGGISIRYSCGIHPRPSNTSLYSCSTISFEHIGSNMLSIFSISQLAQTECLLAIQAQE